jgi:hypothetical protein
MRGDMAHQSLGRRTSPTRLDVAVGTSAGRSPSGRRLRIPPIQMSLIGPRKPASGVGDSSRSYVDVGERAYRGHQTSSPRSSSLQGFCD